VTSDGDGNLSTQPLAAADPMRPDQLTAEFHFAQGPLKERELGRIAVTSSIARIGLSRGV
jgi:hypothetical protein